MSQSSREYKEKRVTPGEELASIEEFIPGPGTYVDSDNGVIRAAVEGVAKYNMLTRTVEVKPLKVLRIPRPGSSAVGMVMQVRHDVVLVELYGEVRLQPSPLWLYEYSGRFLGAIPISNISEEYVRSIDDYYRKGDIVLVKVINGTNPYHLTTVDPPYGVLYAECSRCGATLEPVNPRTMRCPKCGLVEKRKVSVLASSRILKLELRNYLMIPIR
ncbi:MAG: exosome complex RNA-binding protein Csl4 [Desulfurococcales archaeon]|nr:exosome complex RNA-binding protein Csl4 [Desulfurococcales archaeon]MCE4627020.1 exosome complex RNA-binding protein Csl4 [Desulfurococcales archaeon]